MNSAASELKVHRWNHEEWQQLATIDAFQDKRLELIDGLVIDVPALNEPRCLGILLATEEMRKIFPCSRFCIRARMPIRLGNDTELEPDLAVVRGSAREQSLSEHPTTALIVIKTSDHSLKQDRGIKADLYAAGGISDYWIINLPQQQLEVRRKPVRDAKRRFGYRYSQVSIYKSGESIAPLAAKSHLVAVADLLP